jgi:serine/threonine protein kinase
VPLSGRIGEHYEIVKPLGSGAMGEVYLAIDRKMFDRTVAIKFLSERLTDSEEGRLRFRREVETSARLHHPNIVTIYDWGEHQGRDFFVMEFVDGRDLEVLLKAGISWDLEQRLDVAFQMADAVDFAHRAGIIHRDLKPGNVIVVMSDSGPRVKLVDFGIAHVERSNLTQEQSHPGTFAYMSPEQLRGDVLDPSDPRRDLFSLGIVLCQLFGGHHPFEAKSDAMISNRILGDEPDPPSRHGADLPPALETLILRMLAKEAAQRPRTAREVADALREISRKTVAQSVGADPNLTGLDALELQLVESLLTWARQRESEGALADALAAYEKAARLAPDSERIQRKIPDLKSRAARQRELDAELRELERHLGSDRLSQARESLRKAWILGPDDPRMSAWEARIAEREAVSPEAREREEFIAPRMREIDSNLDAGKIDESLAILTQILRRYPDRADAAVMLDRLVRVAVDGIAYGDYRIAVREAWAALKAGAPEAASASRERARMLWPDGPELEALESEILAAKFEARRRAEEAEAVRLREKEEDVRRQHELLERYVEGARNLLRGARGIQPVSPAASQRAIDAFGKAVKALDLVLADRPDHPEAKELREQVLAEIAAIEESRTETERLPEGLPEKPPEPPPVKPSHRSKPRKAPVEEVSRPRFGTARIAAAAVITLILIGIGSFAFWKLTSDPLAKELDQVLRLTENSDTEVAEKMKRIRAIDALLPHDDKRKAELARQGARLENLNEMYVNLTRLERLLDEASGPAAGPGGVTRLKSDAERVWDMLQEYRSKLPDDVNASLLEKKGRSILSEIEDRAGSPRDPRTERTK